VFNVSFSAAPCRRQSLAGRTGAEKDEAAYGISHRGDGVAVGFRNGKGPTAPILRALQNHDLLAFGDILNGSAPLVLPIADFADFLFVEIDFQKPGQACFLGRNFFAVPTGMTLNDIDDSHEEGTGAVNIGCPGG
jgi:hypothetical protein